jgi:hypothetical protein
MKSVHIRAGTEGRSSDTYFHYETRDHRQFRVYASGSSVTIVGRTTDRNVSHSFSVERIGEVTVPFEVAVEMCIMALTKGEYKLSDAESAGLLSAIEKANPSKKA